jgi:hypothetical protein
VQSYVPFPSISPSSNADINPSLSSSEWKETDLSIWEVRGEQKVCCFLLISSFYTPVCLECGC